MSLKIISNQILIQNAAGVTKFNSSDKLLYLKGYQSGSISMGNTDVHTWTTTPTQSASDTVILKIKFNSSNGNAISSFLGYDMMVAGSVLLNIVPGSYMNRTDTEQTILNIAVVRGALIFRKYSVNGGHNLVYANVNFSLTYSWYQYSSL